MEHTTKGLPGQALTLRLSSERSIVRVSIALTPQNRPLTSRPVRYSELALLVVGEKSYSAH